MPNLEWDVPHTLVTPAGSLDLNVTDGATRRRYQILEQEYKIVPSIRVTQDNRSRQDGYVMHERFITGMVATLRVAYWVMTATTGPDGTPACAADLCEMSDYLHLLLNSLRGLDLTVDAYAEQQLIWTPSCASGASGSGSGNDRMLAAVQLLSWPDPARDGAEVSETFSLDSPYGYAIDTVTTTTIVGSTVVIDNPGSAAVVPVVEMDGPASAFTVENETTGETIVYDGSLAGADAIADGHFVRFNPGRGQAHGHAHIDGDPEQDAGAGVDPLATSFFTLQPGENVVTSDGASGRVIWSPGWV